MISASNDDELVDLASLTKMERVELLRQTVIAHATGKASTKPQYVELRKAVLADGHPSELVPRWLRTCFSTGDFWEFIQPKHATYDERRAFLRAEFAKLLAHLEAGEVSPTTVLGNATNANATTVIGDWEVIQRLGEGGQGDVFRVKYRKTGFSRLGAMKICRDRDEKAISRFRREAELLKKHGAEHVGIVKVKEIGEVDGRPFFVMESATASLERVLEPKSVGGRLLRSSPAILLDLFRQVCDAIAHLHRAGVLHRDIKPSNILLMLDPPEPLRAAVADLGVAVAQDEQGALTATHETVGTQRYRAPEAGAPGGHTSASDVYSLGKTLQVLLNGQPPMETGPRPLLRHAGLSEQLWHALDEVVARACAYDPQHRYADADAMLSALPEVVLTHAKQSNADVADPAQISLTAGAAVVLYDLLSQCPDEGDALYSATLARQSRLSEYDFSMGLRELRAAGFIQDAAFEDSYGNSSRGIGPNQEAFKWAREHPEAMTAARPPAPSAFGDDDIPF